MKSQEILSRQDQLYYRLIALWVIVEGVAGGLIHGLNLPFSGMIISGSAVICICLIGYFIPVKGSILKATLIVMIFKMMLSPHSPPTAYLAVIFQGIVGQLLFSNSRYYKLSCIVLGIVALVESAMQRVIVLVALYGSDFWNAINDFIKKLLHVNTVTNYAFWVAMIYFLVHAIGGLFIGLLAARIIKRSKSTTGFKTAYILDRVNADENFERFPSRPRHRKIRNGFFIVWIILACVFMQSLFKIGTPLMPSNKVLQILVRSMLILLTWYFLLSPLITRWIKKSLERKSEQSKTQIKEVLHLLPATELMFRRSWELSREKKGLKRLVLFWRIVMINTLNAK